jgi:GMP reductase
MTQVINEEQLDYCDVLIKPKRSTLNSRKEPNVYRNYTFKWSNRTVEGNGLTVANMATTGTFEMAKIFQHNKMFCCLQKHYSFDRLYEFFTENNLSAKTFDGRICGNDYIFLSTGINTEDINKTKRVLDMGICKNLCIDIANGYIPKLLETVSLFRKEYPDIVIMVGNVVTGDMVQDLILAGADIVKSGIGPGANCTTRKQTGVGRPQLSTVLDCAEAAHAVGGYICADGGITCYGDIAKAYGAGADFVMIGSLVAGTDEAEGDIIKKAYKTNEVDVIDCSKNIENVNPCDYDYDKYDIVETEPQYEVKKFKLAYGMSSKYAQDKHWNGMANYRTSEGIVTLNEYVGPVQNIIDDYLGSLRSTMTYINCTKLKDFPKVTTFYKVHRILNNDGKGIL